MLIQIISHYLESHKRLVIPQLGTFVVKEPGVSVVFSELLRRDDGVLRALLVADGMGELEAAGEIDRFVFEVRHAVEHGAEYRLGGLGLMRPGPNGTIAFEYVPSAEPERLDSEVLVSSAPASELSDGELLVSDTPVSEESGAEKIDAGSRSQLRPEKVAEAVKTAFADKPVTPSVKLNPEPCVRGLRYGKPPKNTNAYTFVGGGPNRKRIDRFLIVAILAAVIAVAAIAFGYFQQAREKRAEAAQTEQSVPDSLPKTAIEPERTN